MSRSFTAAPPRSLTAHPKGRSQFPGRRRNLLIRNRPQTCSSAPCKYHPKVAVPSPPHRLQIVNAHHHQSINGGASSNSSRHTYTIRITTDIPFYEAPEASFDQYLEEKSRVLKALCPPYEKRKPEQISEEEWRIYMEPVEFLFLSVSPVVHMRVRCRVRGGMGGAAYPCGVPPNTSKLLELKVIKSELKGDMDGLIKQTKFELGVEGVVYPERKGAPSCSRIKGQLLMSITFTPPSLLALIPQRVHADAAQLVLRSIGERMERNVSEGLLADYAMFKKESQYVKFD